MNRSSRWRSLLLSGLVVLLTVLVLVPATVIVGYASSFLWPEGGNSGRRLALREPNRGGGEPAQSEDSGVVIMDDPVADYKQALDLLKKNYFGAPVDAKKSRQLTYEAIRGMLASLRDPFTSFLDPHDWRQFHDQTRGNFEGIGAYLLKEGLYVKIARPIENGPAERAGIKADDIITDVDGKTVKGKEINDVVDKIKGPAGTRVTLTIQRGKQTLTFTIRRARVEPPIVKHWMEDKQEKIGRIVLKEFNEKSIIQMESAYQDLTRQGMRGLILDLRYNPGGLLDVAIDVASVFIPRDTNPDLRNVVVTIREGTGREEVRKLVNSDYNHGDLPLVVLVNEGSASASEIVSGAIKDYGVGTVIGERTFGKGKVQKLFELQDGSALRLTTSIYYPPKKYDINFKRDEEGGRIANTGGIVPDIEIKQSPKWKGEDFDDKVNDLQLQKGLVYLRARLKGMTVAQATEVTKKAP